MKLGMTAGMKPAGMPAGWLPAMLLIALGLAGCNRKDAETPGESAEAGIARSVEDVRAAEAAAMQDSAPSRTIGELTGKTAAAETRNGTGAGPKDGKSPTAATAKSPAAAAAAPPVAPPADGAAG